MLIVSPDAFGFDVPIGDIVETAAGKVNVFDVKAAHFLLMGKQVIRLV